MVSLSDFEFWRSAYYELGQFILWLPEVHSSPSGWEIHQHAQRFTKKKVWIPSLESPPSGALHFQVSFKYIFFFKWWCVTGECRCTPFWTGSNINPSGFTVGLPTSQGQSQASSWTWRRLVDAGMSWNWGLQFGFLLYNLQFTISNFPAKITPDFLGGRCFRGSEGGLVRAGV